MIQRLSIEDALENDRCGICGSVDHFRADHPTAAAPPSAAVPDPADVEKAARAEVREQVARWLCAKRNGETGWDHVEGRPYWLADADDLLAAVPAALAAMRPSPDSEAVSESPCPTCVREGGPYRCCPHCADDPGAHENGQRNHHDLPCSICVVTALGTGDREGADRG